MSDAARPHNNGMVRDHVERIATLESQNKRDDIRLTDHDDDLRDLKTVVITIQATLKSNKTAVLAGLTVMGLCLAILQIVLHVTGGG